MWCVVFEMYRVTLRKSASLYDNCEPCPYKNMTTQDLKKTLYCTSLREEPAPFPENGDNGEWYSVLCLIELLLNALLGGGNHNRQAFKNYFKVHVTYRFDVYSQRKNGSVGVMFQVALMTHHTPTVTSCNGNPLINTESSVD